MLEPNDLLAEQPFVFAAVAAGATISLLRLRLVVFVYDPRAIHRPSAEPLAALFPRLSFP